MATRAKSACPIFGAPKEFSENLLPTYEDILRQYNLIRLAKLEKKRGPQAPVSVISREVADKLVQLWLNASLSTISYNGVIKMISTYYNTYKKLLKPFKERRNAESYSAKIKSFKLEAQKLFDICSCKCDFKKCSCEKSKKVSLIQQDFLSDQRTLRNMRLGTIDVKISQQLSKKQARKVKDKNFLLQMSSASTSKGETTESCINSHCHGPEIMQNIVEPPDSDNSTTTLMFSSPPSPETYSLSDGKNIPQMRVKLKCLPQVCDRFGISDRAAAAIASAVLEDMGLIEEGDTSKVVDRNKVRRSRQKKRSELQANDDFQREPVRGLYFDGRKDNTLQQEKVGNKYYKKTAKEEHLTLVQQPESAYIGHIVPKSGSAVDLSAAIRSFLVTKQIDQEKIIAIGCDGTVVNTGVKGGVIRLLEESLKRPLHWFVCQLHSNELPLRHLLQDLDGLTTGPHSHLGQIGKSLETCHLLKVVQFEAIDSDIPEFDNTWDLSTDQKYLLEICNSVKLGQCTTELANRDPGRLNHARWLTGANRILRLYIGTKSPSPNLKVIAEFVMKVYAPLWFAIKNSPTCNNGAKHVFKTVLAIRYLPENLKQIIEPVIQRNAYFAQVENLLLCMIYDERQHIRELAIRRIIQARKNCMEGKIRCFKIPKINFKAIDYIELIDWTACEIIEPPLTKHMSTEELFGMIKGVDTVGIDIPAFPCHTQSVERCVKMVTEAASSVIGAEARDGFIRAKIESRKLMPSFNTKRDYVTKPH